MWIPLVPSSGAQEREPRGQAEFLLLAGARPCVVFKSLFVEQRRNFICEI